MNNRVQRTAAIILWTLTVFLAAPVLVILYRAVFGATFNEGQLVSAFILFIGALCTGAVAGFLVGES